MEKQSNHNVGRNEWVRAALDVLHERGVEGVKVVIIAKRMGITSGSFYWHFKNLRDLLDAMLECWENEKTDHIVEDARSFKGTPELRILNLMLQVVREDAVVPDHAFSIWAKSDTNVREAFDRALRKRFDFAAWMFAQAGFSPEDAQARGRMMVAYLMGESATDLKTKDNWQDVIKKQFEILIAPQN